MSSEVFHHGAGLKKNHRRYPGIRGKRPDHKAYKREEALARAMVYAALPLAEKMKRNPKKYMEAQRASSAIV